MQKIIYNEAENRAYEARLAQFKRDLPKLSAQERRAVQALLRQAEALEDPGDQEVMTRKIALMARACARTNTRRTSDRRRDLERRVLVGARLKREEAQRCREAAQTTDRSLYRFVYDALEREVNKVYEDRPQDIGWKPIVTTIGPSKEKPG